MTEQMNPNIGYLVDDKRITEIIAALCTIEDLKGLTEEEFTGDVMAAKRSAFILQESLSVPRSYADLLKKA